jgi:hypothetical protein
MSSLFLVDIYIPERTTALTAESKAKTDDEFWQKLSWPEEDRYKFTSAPWDGGRRWFRSENVVCLEMYRRKRAREQGQRDSQED